MKILVAFFLIIYSSISIAQSNLNISISKIETYMLTLPQTQIVGPMDIQFDIEYHFAKNIQTKELILHYKIKNIKHQVKFGTLRFKKDNIIYRQDELNTIDGLKGEGFTDLEIKTLKINTSILNLENTNINLSSNYFNKIVMKNATKDLNIDNLFLNIANTSIEKADFINSAKLKNRIDKIK
ncbi:hypothetical protein FLGE108171_09680 [Flavobacterium gelidilacus]|jgi:hypothetical protein|uniref:hypothetical protein n=1 Tax=Flavobacterium gelidilacus TaxID=206041 RepID=UPI000402E16C|nr:hypothetical protein [Flavobacterium gelidilacus]